MADQNDLSSLVACLQSMTSELQKYHASQEAVVEQFKQSNELLLRIASPAENDGQIEGASPPANLEANPYPKGLSDIEKCFTELAPATAREQRAQFIRELRGCFEIGDKVPSCLNFRPPGQPTGQAPEKRDFDNQSTTIDSNWGPAQTIQKLHGELNMNSMPARGRADKIGNSQRSAIIELHSNQGYMPVDYAALVMSQDLSEHDFLTFVAGGSGMLPKSSARAVWPPRRRRYKADQNFRYVIGLKGFVWNSNPEKDLKVGVSYFQLQRDQGTLPAFGSMSTSIVEARTHMHLDLSISQPYSCSAIMVLADVDIDGAMEQPSGFETSTDPFILLHMFINYACKTAATYAKQWNGIVDELDKELSIDLQDLSRSEKLNSLMLDTKDLKLSRMYFKSLHILRIFEINIRQTLQDINRWETLYTLPEYYDSDGLLLARGRKMTGGAIAEQITSFTELLERVRDKQEEIKTLRDGLFNATAMKEALSSGQLNHYVLVFTIATVIFLPLSFVTGFFGMNNIPDDSELLVSMIPFAIMIVCICVGTYAVVGFGILWYDHHEKKAHLGIYQSPLNNTTAPILTALRHPIETYRSRRRKRRGEDEGGIA